MGEGASPKEIPEGGVPFTRVGLYNVDEMIRSLPEGSQTHLGRLSAQTTLSGGQWQRLAQARNAPILIMDEPELERGRLPVWSWESFHA